MRRYPVAILGLCAAFALGACAEARQAPPADVGALEARVERQEPSAAPDTAPDGDFASPVAGGDSGEEQPSCGRLELSDEEWRERLTPEEYRILRESGTERAFTGKYWKTKTPGKYVCAGCELELFSSKTKFESGTGWPSFYDAVKEGHVKTKRDTTFGMVRTEILCGRCDAHLGHVFDDGPQPTGLRYCVNSMSLELVPDEGAEAQD